MVSFSSITGTVKKGWSALVGMANMTTVKAIVEKGGNAYLSNMGQDVEVPIPKNKENVKVSSTITTEEQGSYVANVLQDVKRAPLTEPSDIVLKAERSLPKKTTANDDIKESRDIAYYPAGKNPNGGSEGKKPNLEAIREWVSNTKVGLSSNITLHEEFGEEFGFIHGFGFSQQELDEAIDSVAYKVSRKIWYVGRKPAYMTDIQWQDETKDMRPVEGSFSKNEKWTNGFPYGETYKYQSGKIN